MARLTTQDAEPLAGVSSWQEVLPRFPDDILLRRRGYKIHSRPRDCEAVWVREGVLFGQREALLRCRATTRAP